jgi:hypothetical protein
MCSLAPDSISQWFIWTFIDQEMTVFILEIEGEALEEAMWFMLAGLRVDAGGTKDDC